MEYTSISCYCKSIFRDTGNHPLTGQALSRNPIRSTIASVTSTPPQTSKPIINLGLGDPTSYPLHPPAPTVTPSIIAAVSGERSNGYVPGTGTSTARQAVANYHEKWDKVQYEADDITLVS